MLNRGLLIGASAALIAFAFGCSSQGVIPPGPSHSTTAGSTTMHPLGTTPNGGGTSDGGNGNGDNGGGNASPTPIPLGPVNVVAQGGFGGCSVQYYMCDGTDYLVCDAACGYYNTDTSGDLVLVPPTANSQCNGSTLGLGNSYPKNGANITNIQTVFAPTAGGGMVVAGWLYYQSGSSPTYIELNASAVGVWIQFLNFIPSTSSLYQAITNGSAGIYPAAQNGPNALVNAITNVGGFAQSCFTGPYKG